MDRTRNQLTYANVMATLALFIALGGASYAAISLPKNSVGPKQLKKNAVTTAKIKNGAVRGSKIDIGSLGTVPSARHADNAQTAASAQNALQAQNASQAQNAANAQSAATAANATGLSGPLASGQTLTGVYALTGHREGGGDFVPEETISYPIPLASGPQFNHVSNGIPTAACPGSATDPKAAPGHLCLYDLTRTNISGLADAAEGNGRYGTSVFPTGVGADEDYKVVGVWAVTAP